MEKPKQTFFCQPNSTNYGAGEDSWECKEIKLVNPKGWIFTGRTDIEADAPVLCSPDCEEQTCWKRPWCWERLKAKGEGDDRGWDGWMASPTWWAWVWVSSGSWWWTGRPGVLQSMGSQRAGHNWATELNRRWMTHDLSIWSSAHSFIFWRKQITSC